jgi:hypothetical protein
MAGRVARYQADRTNQKMYFYHDVQKGISSIF